MTDLAQTRSLPPEDITQQIIYAISHDLQGPTRLITSFLQLLEADIGHNLNEQSRSYLDRVNTAADSLQERLGAITLFSRVTSSGQPMQPCSLGRALDAALGLLGPAIAATGSTVEIVGDTPTVLADHAQIEDVFIQVVGNSLKFCEQPANVRIEIESLDQQCSVTISDSGPGFRAKRCDDAFDLFRRFHKATVPGTGTGLAIVRRILQRHGSDAQIDSSPHSNTIVTFALPTAAVGNEALTSEQVR